VLHHKPVIVFVSTYPPRGCGIATFTQDLLQSSRQFLGTHISCKVAALNVSPLDHYIYPPEVAWEVSQENRQEYLELATTLNNNPQVAGVIVQHEYGIYGGEDGEHILAFIENCEKPLLVTLHTVLPNPERNMKEVTSRILNRADTVVVLTENSRKILSEVYPSSIGKVSVIPHGIHRTPFTTTLKPKKKLKLSHATILSTFGLLSRGKGIEYVIHALPEIIKRYPDVRYLILGETHPSVRREEGEKYRLELAELVTKLQLKEHVKFYDQYLDLDDLLEFLQATDIYISTSINPNQAVSGTLSYALGTGRAVVSTSFAQAKEIITPNNGRLVPIKDSAAMSAAIQDILSNPDRLAVMHQAAYDSTRSMLWSQVAKEYSDLLTQLVLPPINLKHLKNMTDDFGLFQFALFSTPNEHFGYTLDDNARALVVCSQLLRQHTQQKGIEGLTSKYLAFIEICQQKDGKFANYLDFDFHKPTIQNTTEDISDATARAVWALGEVIKNPTISASSRNKAEKIFLLSLPNLKTIPHLRSKAFSRKTLIAVEPLLPTHATELHSLISELTDALTERYYTHSHPSWQWFEDHLGYNNAVLPESLIVSGAFLKNDAYLELGLSSLQFLIDQTFSTNMYIPIGHSAWYKRNETRSLFDQQPEDPAATIMALSTAYRVTGQQRYKNLAHKCFSWFLGNNSLHQSLYDYKTGGCFDGLHPDRVNLNQGAESLISYLLSRLAITEIDAHEHPTTS
jgi:glycosyltransferase involved in cell wall biosynthesis